LKILSDLPVPPFNEAYPTGPAFCLGSTAPANVAKGESAARAKVENFMAVEVRSSEVDM